MKRYRFLVQKVVHGKSVHDLWSACSRKLRHNQSDHAYEALNLSVLGFVCVFEPACLKCLFIVFFMLLPDTFFHKFADFKI
jgi:hypothetical protein